MEEIRQQSDVCDTDSKNAAIQDQVKQLLLHAVTQEKYEQKRLFIARCTMMLIAGMLVVLIVVSLLLVPPLVRTIHSARSVVEDLNALDLAALSDNVNGFIKQAGSSMSAIDEAVKQLESLNIDNMNNAIDSLTKAVQSLSKIDVTVLNEAIKNLNDTVTPFARFFGKH